MRRQDDNALLADLGLEFVGSVDEADFIFLVGVPESRDLVETYGALLQRAAARGLPLICANPDLSRVSGSELAEAPGVLARYYEQIGGRTHYHGKPHPPIYRSSLEAMPGIPRGRILAIGDSIDHDILGARRAGLPSALITAGIHAAELGAGLETLPTPERWSAFAQNAPAIPDYLLPGFIW
jgi:HAD superfamily hydrolase (TIGR01459 family)